MGKCCKPIITSIGGQALFEGIMMKGPKKTVVAVKTPNDGIYKEELKTNSLMKKNKIFQLPLIRGIIGIIDTFRESQKAMMISMAKSGALESEENEPPTKFEKFLDKVFGDKITNVLMGFATVLGVALSVLLFFFLPTWLFNISFANISFFTQGTFYRSLFEGLLKLIILLSYLLLCSQLKDIKRVFMYHGAEHKTIACYEDRKELTVENVRKYTRFHPRCGTSFLILMLLVGIAVGMLIPFENTIIRSITKILCIPLLVGLGYELIKICGKHNNFLTRLIAAPGKWVQRITTKEPTDEMIEVAILAMKEVIPENGEDQI